MDLRRGSVGEMTGPASPSPELAALESVDPDRLLPGEPIRSDRPEVASRWLAVYRDLLSAKRAMVRSALRRLETASPEAQKEFRTTDATILAAERRRVQKRLDYWRRRARVLRTRSA